MQTKINLTTLKPASGPCTPARQEMDCDYSRAAMALHSVHTEHS